MYLTLRRAWSWGCCAAQRGASPLATVMRLSEISGFKSTRYGVLDKSGLLAKTLD
ncbi:hypothetical protein [Pseudomonas sp. Leaf59]|uniref:hypothetical protein n=1 Tax=Pseudomonas sp. Leaf59 TaxID=2876556 RepID=UPI001E39B4D7|nr:hypothetical protein [Pseudomonas sp. Leaf59]